MKLRDVIPSMYKSQISEATSLDAIMAAVGKEKDEQQRASMLSDIAWKENLPGLYDPVSGYYVRKQSMPTRGQKYSIGATASRGDDLKLSSLGLIPDNAKTTSPVGNLVNRISGADGAQYDRDIRARSQAANANKPPSGQAPQADRIQGVAGAPSNQTAPGQEFGTDVAFAGNKPQEPSQADIAAAMSQHGNTVAQRGQDKDLAAKRSRYAELVAKAKTAM